MAVHFTLGGTTINLQNPLLDNVISVEKLGAGNRSAGGTRYWYSKGITLYTLKLSWRELREAEKRDLQDFFDNTADGPRLAFIYVDHRGYSWAAHFQDTMLEFTEVADRQRGAAGTFTPSDGVAYPTTDRYRGTWATDLILEVEEIPTTTWEPTTTTIAWPTTTTTLAGPTTTSTVWWTTTTTTV